MTHPTESTALRKLGSEPTRLEPGPRENEGIDCGARHPGSEPARAKPAACPPAEHDVRRIRELVISVLDRDADDQERRWEPRVPFVRAASVTFRIAGAIAPDFSKQPDHDRDWQQEGQVACVTTDMSTSGVGIVTFCSHLPGRVNLELCGRLLECDVLWSRSTGPLVYRHGLRFRKVLDGE